MLTKKKEPKKKKTVENASRLTQSKQKQKPFFI